MASLSKDGNGWRILFVCPDTTKRRTIRLGSCAKKRAQTALNMVEDLIVAKSMGSPPDQQTAAWLRELAPKIRKRIAKSGLTRAASAVLLAPFVDGYIQGRSDVKKATATVYGHTRRNLVEFFGPDRPLRDITPGDADDFRLHLVKEGLADNTVRRRCGIAKQYFTAAVKKKLLTANPFEELKSHTRGNPSKFHFISREDAAKILDACPNANWRLIIALARYGGLRCPSEVLSLRWENINWAESRVLVTSPKTEHHEGGETRMIPLFPELRPYLQEAWDLLEEGEKSEYVITGGYLEAAQGPNGWQNANLRTQFERIIRRAGLAPWPKLFQNLRSTRQTELAETRPAHVVCAWIGNSERVANQHYLQLTDDHFTKAASEPSGDMPTMGTTPQTILAHIPAQSPHKTALQGSSQETENPAKHEVCGALSSGGEPPNGRHGTRTCRGMGGVLWRIACI